MSKDEKITLAVVGLLILAVLIWRKPIVAAIAESEIPVVDEIGVSMNRLNTSMTKGPDYLMYNMPYAFSPPIGNFLPSITAGQIGQTVNRPTNFDEYWTD